MNLDGDLCAGDPGEMGITWLLVGLGVVVAAMAVERGLALLRTRADPLRLRAELGRALGRGDLVGARMCVVTSRSVEAQVVAAGFAALPRGAAAIEERMASEIHMTRIALERRLGLFEVVAFAAPLLGVLGTFLGLLRVVPVRGCEAAVISAAEGRAALTATVVGLAVAILAGTSSTYFKQRIAARVIGAEALGRYVLSFLKDERRDLLDRAAKEAA